MLITLASSTPGPYGAPSKATVKAPTVSPLQRCCLTKNCAADHRNLLCERASHCRLFLLCVAENLRRTSGVWFEEFAIQKSVLVVSVNVNLAERCVHRRSTILKPDLDSESSRSALSYCNFTHQQAKHSLIARQSKNICQDSLYLTDKGSDHARLSRIHTVRPSSVQMLFSLADTRYAAVVCCNSRENERPISANCAKLAAAGIFSPSRRVLQISSYGSSP